MLKQGFAGEKINFQAVHGRREYAKAILCYSVVWKPGAKPSVGS